MRNLQAAFAKWYNKTFERRGRFWGDRFKSLYLEDLNAVLDCMLYVELNAVRAGLVKRPEDWKGCSTYIRDISQDQRIKTKDYKGKDYKTKDHRQKTKEKGWLYPISEILGDEKDVSQHYRNLLYYRGAVPTKEGQVSISEDLIKEEEERGFVVSGMYRKQLRHFVDGIMLGNEENIRRYLNQMREKGEYLRRKNPIQHLDGFHFTLREQRSHAVCF